MIALGILVHILETTLTAGLINTMISMNAEILIDIVVLAIDRLHLGPVTLADHPLGAVADLAWS
ncbi:hypothetical protein DSO57_1014196 [Entomophthora muscae]|uniref:Uncharacterized protein n=1 Tax=Entomophthora muscae TaxID=34485 RepID=A0ACC2T5E8_9FUNG|nr:hypothetical protein DSO57_1014196 [Entomophthora muscae]